jgi:hypothetical protein
LRPPCCATEGGEKKRKKNQWSDEWNVYRNEKDKKRKAAELVQEID